MKKAMLVDRSSLSACEPFAVTGEATARTPLVFASPHSGRIYPETMGARDGLGLAALRSAEDVLVDQLVASAPEHGAPLLTGLIGRAYLDLNRPADDLDPELIDGASGTGPRVAAGYGVAPRLTGCGQAIYDRRLSLAEAEARIAAVHRPYHAAMGRLMAGARERFGVAALLDWHSMPTRATQRRGVRGADVVLGDRHGAAAAGDVTRRLRTLFEAAGWRVALNHPYAGGYATQTWGRPDEGYHAVQIELSRGLYLDEATLEPSAGYGRAATVVAGVIADMAGRDWAGLLGARRVQT
jgi:N-formylglutamate amidohydrolase